MRPENYEATRHPPSNEYELNIGPNHPGIEGNYAIRLKLHGDTVIEARADAGYLHRGFEKLMEGRLWIQNLAITPRICVPDPVPMEVSYVMAVEDLCGLEVPERAQWLRVMQLELSRIAAHLFTFGGHASTTGMYTTMYWGIADRDLILDLFEELCGGRVYHIYNIPGGVRRDTPDGFLERVADTLDYLESRLPDYDNLLFTNQVFIKRAKGVGVINRQQALDWAVTGPNLRATGFEWDLRKARPYSGYDRFDFDIPTGTRGDCFDRTAVRVEEMRQSLRIIRQCLENMPSGEHKARHPLTTPPLKDEMQQGTMHDIETLIHHFVEIGWGPVIPAGEACIAIEATKGINSYYLTSDHGSMSYRTRIRTPSFPHLQMIPAIARGHTVADLVAILGSIDFVMADVDR